MRLGHWLIGRLSTFFDTTVSATLSRLSLSWTDATPSYEYYSSPALILSSQVSAFYWSDDDPLEFAHYDLCDY
jgi:hypothetical protein